MQVTSPDIQQLALLSVFFKDVLGNWFWSQEVESEKITIASLE